LILSNVRFMIEIIQLKKHYGFPEKRIIAIDSVSFKVECGIVFGLLGPNGAGKTTIIKILTTLTKPDSGRCMIDGFDVVNDAMEIKKRIGIVPQENNLERELTAYENLFIYGMLYNIKNLKEKIEEKLRMVGIWERKDSIVSHFSGGMQRRLLIARALLSNPSILFLDEPTIGLDPHIRRQLWDIIRKIRIDGRTVVLTTHYIEEADALCDSIGILVKGRLIALDTPSNLKKLVGEYAVDMIDDEGRLMQYMFKTREEAHKKASELPNGVTIRRSNLEDVFVKLTGRRIE